MPPRSKMWPMCRCLGNCWSYLSSTAIRFPFNYCFPKVQVIRWRSVKHERASAWEKMKRVQYTTKHIKRNRDWVVIWKYRQRGKGEMDEINFREFTTQNDSKDLCSGSYWGGLRLTMKKNSETKYGTTRDPRTPVCWTLCSNSITEKILNTNTENRPPAAPSDQNRKRQQATFLA